MLEVTEGVLIDNPDEAKARLDALKALGMRLALDDFGTGYSSLTYLQRFRFDKLKIDRGFVDAAGRDAGQPGAWCRRSWRSAARSDLTCSPKASRPRSSACCCGWPAATRCRAICSPGPAPREALDRLVAETGRATALRAAVA